MKLIVFISLLFLTGCQSETPKEAAHFFGIAMTMNYHVVVGCPLSQKEKDSIQKTLDSTFSQVDRTFNRYHPESELSYLNNLGKNEPAVLSAEMDEIFKIAQKTVEMTQGKFDPTIHGLQLIWKKHLENGKLPSKEEIDSVSDAIGWEKIHIKGRIFKKDHDKLQIDLGGIAKGHCIDLLISRLQEMGYQNLFVEWGGEIRASGEHPDNRPWTIMISRLGDLDPERAVDILPLVDEAVATSGDYLQYWEVGEKKYCHIINPQTLKPLQSTPGSIASVTVKAPTCALADALATAGMLFDSVNEAKAWAESLRSDDPSLSFWFITQ
jgi:FAD:protein FMN transferase